jgi:hypothetical protein
MYPQPHVFARIRKGIPGFQHATIIFGKPFAFLTEGDLVNAPDGLNLQTRQKCKRWWRTISGSLLISPDSLVSHLAGLQLDHNSKDQGRTKNHHATGRW